MSDNQENLTMNIDNTNTNEETNTNVNEETNTNTNEETTVNNKQIDLTKNVTTNIGLLVNLKRVVDICVARGAFKSEELTQLGSVIDSLNLVLKDNIE